MTRLEKIKTMPVEKMARLIMDSNNYNGGRLCSACSNAFYGKGGSSEN